MEVGGSPLPMGHWSTLVLLWWRLRCLLLCCSDIHDVMLVLRRLTSWVWRTKGREREKGTIRRKRAR
eukprot:2336393-Ditylum_brightwellii.AAC.1